MENVKVMGKIEAERPCDCCGNKILKVAVVISLDGQLVHYGRDCAGRLLFGRKSAANGRKAEKAADAADFAREAMTRQKMLRVAASKNEANRQYASTGRPLPGSFFAVRGGDVVRVDGSDTADASFYADAGFAQA